MHTGRLLNKVSAHYETETSKKTPPFLFVKIFIQSRLQYSRNQEQKLEQTLFKTCCCADVLYTMCENRIEANVLPFVYARLEEPALMVRIGGIKNAGSRTTILPGLNSYSCAHKYSSDVEMIYNSL